MKKLDLILLIIAVVLVIACGVLEFVPVAPTVRTIVLAVTAFYSLFCLVYFALTKAKLQHTLKK